MEQQRSAGVLDSVVPAMMAGIEVSFMGIGGFGEHLVELFRAGLETVVVLGSAVEVDFQAIEFLRIPGDGHWIVCFPVGQILIDGEYPVEQALKHLEPSSGHPGGGEVLEKNGAVGAYRSEQIGMFEGNFEGAVAAHGDTADSASGPRGIHAV